MITRHNQRVFYSDNGVLTDLTLSLNRFRQGELSLSYTAGEDFIYVGSDLPFANRYFCLNTANATANTLKVEVWGGTGDKWVEVADLLDDTVSAGASLGRDGVASWYVNDDDYWQRDDSEDITELDSRVIYNLYWMRFSWDADFSAVINHIGYRFCEDDEIYSFYPDLDNQQFRDCFEPDLPEGTKTDWKEQCMIASANVIRHMKSKNIIWTPSQILDFESIKDATIHETARIIYAALDTEAYAEDYKRAGERFGRAFNIKKFNVDQNKTTRLDCDEQKKSVTYMSR
jgi:hypothetical protein